MSQDAEVGTLGIRVKPLTDGHGFPICERCRERIDPDALDVMVLVVGWVENRSGGGAHAVSDKRVLGLYRHKGCHKYGDPADRPGLF